MILRFTSFFIMLIILKQNDIVKTDKFSFVNKITLAAASSWWPNIYLESHPTAAAGEVSHPPTQIVSEIKNT